MKHLLYSVYVRYSLRVLLYPVTQLAAFYIDCVFPSENINHAGTLLTAYQTAFQYVLSDVRSFKFIKSYKISIQ